MPAPLLVIGIGNPSRGDDALGPLFIERVEILLADELARGQIELLTDFQLQLEHALDLAGRARVVFVDARCTPRTP
jgi:hydrogenase maturation protease